MAYDDSKNTALMGICEKPSKNRVAVAVLQSCFLLSVTFPFLKWDVLTASGQHLGTEMHISTVPLECTCLPTVLLPLNSWSVLGSTLSY